MRRLSLTLAVGAALGSACTGTMSPIDDVDDPGPVSGPEADAIDDFVRSLPSLPTAEPQVTEGPRSPDVRDGDYSCSSQSLSETRQYDRIIAFQANSEAMWPGAILAGDSVYSGQFKQLVFDRRPLTVSVSLENLDGAKSAVLEAPSLSASREAVSRILSSNVSGATPANIYAEIEQVHSERQLGLALGVDVSWLGSVASVGANFDFNDTRKRSRYVVKYTQAYYTVDVDQPRRPSDFFAGGVTVADLDAGLGDRDPPLYVSSITYGRQVVFTFESEYAGTEVESALRFAFTSGVEVSGETSVTYKDILESSKITAFILGGSGGEAARSIDSYQALLDFIKSGGDYSRDSPGAPIAYKLAYLADNAPARLSFTTEYDLTDCVRVSQKIKVTLKRIAQIGGGELEVHGLVTAAADSATTLFQRADTSYLPIGGDAYIPTDGVPLAERIIQVTPNENGVIRLRAHLVDDDVIGSTELGDETVEAPFLLGWRRDVPITLSDNGKHMVVTIGLEPI
jgi:thiol-activated cytolysin